MTNRVARIREEVSVLGAAETVALAGLSDRMVVDASGRFAVVDEIIEAGGSLEGAFERFVARGRDLAALPIAPLVIRDPIVLDPDDHAARAAVVPVEPCATCSPSRWLDTGLYPSR